MKYSDRELEQADDFLGMSPEEQMYTSGKQQVRKNDGLKPCPCCGGKPNSGGFTDPIARMKMWAVSCSSCGIAIEEYNRDVAFYKWNTRTEPKEQGVCPECSDGIIFNDCPVCNGTGKAPVDKIREAFEKVQGISSFVIWSGKDNKYILTPDAMGSHAHWMILANDLFNTFKNWYPELYKSQQAEIERLTNIVNDLHEELSESNIKGIDLKAENETMKRAGDVLYKQYDLVVRKNWELSPIMAGSLEAVRSILTN